MNSQLNVRRKDTYLIKSTFENKYAINMKHDKLHKQFTKDCVKILFN
jgi:hypothetical protein